MEKIDFGVFRSEVIKPVDRRQVPKNETRRPSQRVFYRQITILFSCMRELNWYSPAR